MQKATTPNRTHEEAIQIPECLDKLIRESVKLRNSIYDVIEKAMKGTQKIDISDAEIHYGHYSFDIHRLQKEKGTIVAIGKMTEDDKEYWGGEFTSDDKCRADISHLTIDELISIVQHITNKEPIFDKPPAPASIVIKFHSWEQEAAPIQLPLQVTGLKFTRAEGDQAARWYYECMLHPADKDRVYDNLIGVDQEELDSMVKSPTYVAVRGNKDLIIAIPYSTEQIKAMRDWLTECTFADIEAEEIEELPVEKIIGAVAKHFEGGLQAFILSL